RGGLPGLFLWISSGALGPSSVGSDSRQLGGGLSGSVRRRPARVLRFDPSRQADGLPTHADRGSHGAEADSHVAGNAGDRGDRGQRDQGHSARAGNISPLLANIYLHWFDKRFHAKDGPAHWDKARLVRYADDFVVMARRQSPQLTAWVERMLEDWLGLKINRTKTRIVNLSDEGTHLDFLGYQFRYDRDRFGRGSRYLHWCPSAK